MIDQKVNALRADIGRESKVRYESIEHLENCLEVRKLKFYLFRMISLNSKKR